MRARLNTLAASCWGMFQAGEVVSDAQVPRRVLEQWIAYGAAESVGVADKEVAVQPEAETADIRHIGGPWYEVAGRKIRGRRAAEQAAGR